MSDDDPLLRQLLLQLLLIAVNAVFACAEIALLSVNGARVAKRAAEGDKRARRLLSLTREPARFLATIQVGITLAGFLASAFAAQNFSEKLVATLLVLGLPFSLTFLKTASLVVITVILSFFTLVLGELLPKRIAMKKSEPLAYAMSAFVYAVNIVFSPAVSLLSRATNALLRLIGIDPHADDRVITEEDIRLLVDEGSEKGVIEQTEQEIIHHVFEFGDSNIGDVMTHRSGTVFLWQKDDDEVWEAVVSRGRHSHYPVCGDTFDDVTGVLSAREYLLLKDRRRAAVMERAVRPPEFVPESQKAAVLFRKMKTTRRRFVVVLDEYGGTSGIVTMEDLVEALVGSLER
jgi:putative hemolysin